MRQLIEFIRRYRQRKLVRPWALLVPMLILLICAPLLRPIRHPEPESINDDELARLATIQSFSEHKDLAIDHSDFKPRALKLKINAKTYAQQPPAMAVVLAGPYTIMRRFGVSFGNNPTLATYLLTLLGATLPCAAGAGLIYRMGRLFELSRWKRALLAFACAFGTGWVSYATVLTGYSAAAALMVAAAAALVHWQLSRKPGRAIIWMLSAGVCAALGAVIEPGCAIFVPLLFATIFTMRQKKRLRLSAALLYLAGCLVSFGIHYSLTKPTIGDWRLTLQVVHATSFPDDSPAESDEDPAITSPVTFAHRISHFFESLFASHGLFSHFPVLVMGIAGIPMVMHRHWPGSTKMLASASGAFALGVVALYISLDADWHGGMYAARAFLVFSPLLLFWAGVWMRNPHYPATWAVVGSTLLYSVIVTLIGMAHPTNPAKYDSYSPADTIADLIASPKNQSTTAPTTR